jgi:histidinol-phosphatase (PHP family)
VYNAEYDTLERSGLKIRRGMEFGMTVDNREQFKKDLQRMHFDFVLGSIHFVDDLDVYYEEYWQDKTVFQAERRYLEATLETVKLHEDFDVLAHLTYIGKTRCHKAPRTVPFAEHRELIDEILRTLADKGKGMEMNTSGVNRCGGYLPTADYFRRFKELGGEIVTVGSDAHTADRVGEYTFEACEILKDIFGYVCTFEDRKPIFHKL